MNLIAHRGLKMDSIKENSLEAFQSAISNSNYVGFELDIRTSKDGIFVVHHNLFIDGELVRFLDYSELKNKYDICSLEDVLKLKTDKIILIEIKEDNIDVKSLIDLCNRYKNRNIYLDSFDNKVIKKIMDLEHYVKLGVLNYVFNSEKDYHRYDFIGLLAPIVTEDLIRFFHQKNIEVFLYGIQNQKELGKWEDVFYITDAIQK